MAHDWKAGFSSECHHQRATSRCYECHPMEASYPSEERDDGWAQEVERAKQEQMKRYSGAVAAPVHYRFGNNLQTIDLIYEVLAKQQDGFLAYCLGNIFKYLTRYGRKDGLQDLKKAQQYLAWIIEHIEKGRISHE